MSKLPTTALTLSRHLRQQQRQMVRLADTSAFALSGTSVTAEGVVTVDGELDVTGAMVVGGTLSLPAGIVGNDALTSPVVPQAVYLQVSNFALTTSEVTLASSVITVPAGFTSAIVTLIGQVRCYNLHSTGGSNGAGGDYVLSQPFAGSHYGNALGAILLGSGGDSYDITPLTAILTGLTGGGTFTVGIQGASYYVDMAANTYNSAVLSGNILWLR